MKYLSTFSGIGGFELGIQQAYGILDNRPTGEVEQEVNTQEDLSDTESKHTRKPPHCIGYSEIDKYAASIYQRHFPNHKNYGDITTINAEELPDFDLLVGGFPCQAFSIAGKRGGFEDTRGTMFFELARILRAKQPRLFVFENVKGLLSHDGGKSFATIIQTLDELGYDCQWQVLNSKNHGVPQNRERVFIIGHLRGTPRPEVFPFTEDQEQNTGDKSKTWVADFRNDEGMRVRKNGCCPTLPAHLNHMATSSSPSDLIMVKPDAEIRRLTPVECERLQGFPDGWTDGVSDTQRYKTLGNAVTVNVIRDIFERIL